MWILWILATAIPIEIPGLLQIYRVFYKNSFIQKYRQFFKSFKKRGKGKKIPEEGYLCWASLLTIPSQPLMYKWLGQKKGNYAHLTFLSYQELVFFLFLFFFKAWKDKYLRHLWSNQSNFFCESIYKL